MSNTCQTTTTTTFNNEITESMDCKDESPIQAEVVDSDDEDMNTNMNVVKSDACNDMQSDICSNDQIISLFATLSK